VSSRRQPSHFTSRSFDAFIAPRASKRASAGTHGPLSTCPSPKPSRGAWASFARSWSSRAGCTRRAPSFVAAASAHSSLRSTAPRSRLFDDRRGACELDVVHPGDGLDQHFVHIDKPSRSARARGSCGWNANTHGPSCFLTSSAQTSSITSMPPARKIRIPFPFTRGFGAGIPVRTRLIPRPTIACAHAGVRPWNEHGSSVK